MKIEMTKVLEYLKPKVKALGFKKDDLESIAADIADNLEEVDDEASDEDVNAKIKPAVDAVIPSLKIAQKMANRAIEDYRKKQEKANEPKPEPEPKQEPKPEPKQEPKQEPSSTPSKKEETEAPQWVKELIESNKAQMEQQKQLIETLKAEVDGIKTKTTAEKRKAVLEDILKDTGNFKDRTFKSYARMTFATDEDFNEYVSEVKEELEQLNQERANAGLAKLGVPTAEAKPTVEEKPAVKALTDAEVEELAASM